MTRSWLNDAFAETEINANRYLTYVKKIINELILLKWATRAMFTTPLFNDAPTYGDLPWCYRLTRYEITQR